MKLEALAAGLGAGVLIGAVTRVIETSRLEVGPYALYGNGALAVPVILAPLLLFAGWSWLVRRTGWGSGAIAVYALGIVLGSGMGYGAAAGSIGAAGPATLGIGLFVVPTALLAAITVTLLRRQAPTSTPALVAAYLFGGLIGAIPPFAFIGGLGINGISAGAAIVAGERASLAASLALGGALALLVLVQAFALPLVVGPLFASR